MRLNSKYIAIACMTALLVSVAGGCGGSDESSSGNSNVAPSVTTAVAAMPTSGAVATTPASATTGTAPSSEVVVTAAAPGPVAASIDDPCDLLTSAVAAKALGVPVGEPATQPGEGNTSCSYRPADPGAKGLVILTLYGVIGTQAVLQTAALQFPGAEPVDGLGDAAQVSVQSQVIGVLTGTTVFALGLYPTFPQEGDGQQPAVSKDQLIAVARAVLDGQ